MEQKISMYSSWDTAGQDVFHPRTLGELRYRTTGPGPLPNIVYKLVKGRIMRSEFST